MEEKNIGLTENKIALFEKILKEDVCASDFGIYPRKCNRPKKEGRRGLGSGLLECTNSFHGG